MKVYIVKVESCHDFEEDSYTEGVYFSKEQAKRQFDQLVKEAKENADEDTYVSIDCSHKYESFGKESTSKDHCYINLEEVEVSAGFSPEERMDTLTKVRDTIAKDIDETVGGKTVNESFEDRFIRLGSEAFDLAKKKLASLPDKKLILRAPVSMHIDTGNGFVYDLDARTVFLMADSIQVFGDDFDLSRLDEENGWDDLQPDEYWCEGGEWYAGWEGLFCLLDEIINTPAERLVEVDWETDGEDTDLPSQVSVPNNVIEDDDVADWLSDKYGSLVSSWKEI